MHSNLDEEAETVAPSIDVQPISIQEDPSNIPAALHEDQRFIPVLDAEVEGRSLRLSAARIVLGERHTTLEQAVTRQETARQLYTLSKNMMDQIKRGGQLKTAHRGPRDESSRHERSLSSMDQSRQALVDRTVATLRDAIAELQAASSDFTIAQRNVATAEAFVAYASRSLQSAELQRGFVKRFLNEEASALLPTPELPEGLWRRIFAIAVAEESDLPRKPQGDTWQEWGFHSLALPLSHVCKEWRRIAISTPNLWTGIQIVYTKERKLRPQFIHRMIGLAGSSPLTIAITLTHEIIGSAAGQITDAFSEDSRVRHIKCQVTENAAPSLRYLLDVIPAAQTLTFTGLSVPMQPASNPVKLPSKHVMSATTINISNVLLERLPPFFIVPAPPWGLRTLYTDIPSLLRIDIGGTAPVLQTIVISQPPPQAKDLQQQQRAPWYDAANGFNVENVTATHLVIHSMSRGHMAPLIRYVSRLRSVAKLELYGISAQSLLVALKENSEGSQKIWLPSLNELVIHDYESHGPALGLYVAARLDLAQRSLMEGEFTIQPLQQVVLDRCSNMSDEIVALIREHCVAGMLLYPST
jgi:F-box-like